MAADSGVLSRLHKLQARVKEQGLVVPFVSELEVSPVGVDCVSQVGPKWKVIRRKKYFSFD